MLPEALLKRITHADTVIRAGTGQKPHLTGQRLTQQWGFRALVSPVAPRLPEVHEPAPVGALGFARKGEDPKKAKTIAQDGFLDPALPSNGSTLCWVCYIPS